MPGGFAVNIRLQDLAGDVNLTSPVQGDILVRGANNWINLGHGVAGQLLQTNGVNANPSWITPVGGGGGVPGGIDKQIQFNDNGAFGGSAQFTFDKTTGKLTLTPTARTSGSPNILVITGPADTTLAASAEATDVNLALNRTVQFATGNIATQRAVRIQGPTYAFVGASTITTAVTLDVTSPPVAGANATLTNRIGLRVSTASSQDTAIQAKAGTGNYNEDLFSAYDNSGARIFAVGASGTISLASGGNGINRVRSDPGFCLTASALQMQFGNSFILAWSSTGNWYDTNDVGLARNAAGVLRVTNGSTGAGALICGVNDNGTTTIVTGLTVRHDSSGTPAAGFGVSIVYQLGSSTTADRLAAEIDVLWATATDASRKGRITISTWDATAAREGLRIETDGTQALIGFFGSAAGAKPTITGSKGGNVALASLLTALAGLGLLIDSTT